MSASLSIKLKRANKVYHEGETVAGVVAVSSAGELRHEGLTLALEGGVTLQAGARSAGLLDALGGGGKPLPLVSASLELAVGGRLPAGVTEIPFELPLRARPGAPPLLETYHGVFVNVVYALRCSMRRSFLNKPLADSCQIFVQQRPRESAVARPVRCEITPGSVRAGGGARHNMPHFQIYVELHSTVCALDRPVTGQIRVEECSVPIKSIELQLVRVETCGSADGYTRDATEIQNIQVGAGDVCRARAVPLYMLLPRLFTCPTTTTPHFKIEFELNIAVIFEDDYLVTENFPILLLRSR